MLICFLRGLADDRVPTELKKNIMQARMDKKLTQAQLSQVNDLPLISYSLSYEQTYIEIDFVY